MNEYNRTGAGFGITVELNVEGIDGQLVSDVVDTQRDSKPTWECEECGAENEIPAAVVDMCSEHWTSCKECGERVAFNFSGATA